MRGRPLIFFTLTGDPMMDRRAFLTALGLEVLTPRLAAAQQTGRLWRVGVLWFSGTPEQVGAAYTALREGFRERGYVEGRNLVIEHRFADGRAERLPALAAELAKLGVDVFVVGVDSRALVVRRATTTIPIVMAAAEDPVGAGLVQSLARPGGNITGLTIVAGPEIFGKNLELLTEALPKGARVAILFNPASRINALYLKATEEAARSLGVRFLPIGVRSAEDFEGAFLLMKQKHAAGFVVLGEALFTITVNRRRINDLALEGGLASMWPIREGADAGGLMSYGTHQADLFRRAPAFVDKIFKGAKPGDLPMEQPTKFEFVINMKTARALGLTIPQSLLGRADEVIR